MKEKKEKVAKTGMSRLLELAATKKPLMIGAIILSSMASIASFIPYIAIYLMVKEILEIWPNKNMLDTALAIQYGGIAFLGVTLNIILYFLGLLTFSCIWNII